MWASTKQQNCVVWLSFWMLLLSDKSVLFFWLHLYLHYNIFFCGFFFLKSIHLFFKFCLNPSGFMFGIFDFDYSMSCVDGCWNYLWIYSGHLSTIDKRHFNFLGPHDFGLTIDLFPLLNQVWLVMFRLIWISNSSPLVRVLPS